MPNAQEPQNPSENPTANENEPSTAISTTKPNAQEPQKPSENPTANETKPSTAISTTKQPDTCNKKTENLNSSVKPKLYHEEKATEKTNKGQKQSFLEITMPQKDPDERKSTSPH